MSIYVWVFDISNEWQAAENTHGKGGSLAQLYKNLQDISYLP